MYVKYVIIDIKLCFTTCIPVSAVKKQDTHYNSAYGLNMVYAYITSTI